MTDAAAPPRSAGWKRFLFGFIAPFATPFIVAFMTDGTAPPWAYGAGFLLLFAAGLLAGIQHRNWGFLGGVLAAIAAFTGFVLLHRAGWISLP